VVPLDCPCRPRVVSGAGMSARRVALFVLVVVLVLGALFGVLVAVAPLFSAVRGAA
jgi:hypothetical protein